MGHRINAEVVYFKSNKNSCLLDKLEQIDSDISVDRKGAKKHRRVRYAIQGFSSKEHLQTIKQKVKQLLKKAPLENWSVRTVKVTV